MAREYYFPAPVEETYRHLRDGRGTIAFAEVQRKLFHPDRPDSWDFIIAVDNETFYRELRLPKVRTILPPHRATIALGVDADESYYFFELTASPSPSSTYATRDRLTRRDFGRYAGALLVVLEELLPDRFALQAGYRWRDPGPKTTPHHTHMNAWRFESDPSFPNFLDRLEGHLKSYVTDNICQGDISTLLPTTPCLHHATGQ